jgi:hypothetical protein
VNGGGEGITGAGLTNALYLAAGGSAGAEHRSFVSNYAAGFCSAAIDSDEEWHEGILTGEVCDAIETDECLVSSAMLYDEVDRGFGNQMRNDEKPRL